MRIIITGATGFLGNALCQRLLARGNQVVALGRDRDKLRVLADAGATAIALELSSPIAPPPLEADAMVHAAALSSPWGRKCAFVAANIEGTRFAIAIARAARVRRFVHVSTPSVYFRLADQLNLKEDHPLPPPINSYAATKAAAEALVADAEDLDPVVLRPRGIYGRGDTSLLPRLLAAAKRRALPLIRDGRAVTDLTHVDDVVSAVICALDAPPRPKQNVFNISGGAALKIRDVANSAATRAGVDIRWRRVPLAAALAYARAGEAFARLLPGNPEPTLTVYSAGLFAFSQTLDISRARRELGWTPRIGFDEGLERSFAEAA